MRGIEVPERTEDFTADPVELFFDLAFVFAFSQLVSLLIADPDWSGIGEAALLFLLLWLPWTQFTWSANAVSGNGRAVRLIMLVATIAVVPAAAAVTTALDEGGMVFAVPISLILLLGLALIATAHDTDSPEFTSTLRYMVPNMAAVAVLVLGAFLDDEARVVAWLVALGIVVVATVAAGEGDWIVRVGHFSERHGLILIMALGEVIVAIGIPVVDSLGEGEGIPAPTLWSLVGAGALAGLLWWGYFDRPSPAFEHRGSSLEGRELGRYARDVYTYTHMPIVAGVVLAAAALEEITLHPEDPLPAEFRYMLLAGLLGYLFGVVIGIVRAYGVIARERLGCAVVLAAILLVAESWDGLVLLLAIDLVLFATLVLEHLRVERPLRAEKAAA